MQDFAKTFVYSEFSVYATMTVEVVIPAQAGINDRSLDSRYF